MIFNGLHFEEYLEYLQFMISYLLLKYGRLRISWLVIKKFFLKNHLKLQQQRRRTVCIAVILPSCENILKLDGRQREFVMNKSILWVSWDRKKV